MTISKKITNLSTQNGKICQKSKICPTAKLLENRYVYDIL